MHKQMNVKIKALKPPTPLHTYICIHKHKNTKTNDPILRTLHSYNVMSSLVRFEKKNIFLYVEKTP
jgi:hypothetical protein